MRPPTLPEAVFPAKAYASPLALR
ncbi:protein of unknown function [Rhodovastum atsumiense]|nr:protein of unknown function [Rhodovastum atsumiense]